VYPVPWLRVTVLVEVGVVELAEVDGAKVEEAGAVIEAEPEAEEEPPETWKGKEYWKVDGSESSSILMP